MVRQLEADGRIQTMVHTRFNEMIRMSGTATPAAEDEQAKWIDTIFAEQPYLANVYPGNTREIGIIFEVRDITLDYFNLGVHPIERAVFSLGKAPVQARGIPHRPEHMHRVRHMPRPLPTKVHRRRRRIPHRTRALSALRRLF